MIVCEKIHWNPNHATAVSAASRIHLLRRCRTIRS